MQEASATIRRAAARRPSHAVMLASYQWLAFQSATQRTLIANVSVEFVNRKMVGSDAATALACLNEELPEFHYMIAGFGGAIRCAPYETFGTQVLADVAITALKGRSACLLANHGMVVFARSAEQALSQAVLLETLARQYLLARSAGTVRLLTREEMRAARARFRDYGPAARNKDR